MSVLREARTVSVCRKLRWPGLRAEARLTRVGDTDGPWEPTRRQAPRPQGFSWLRQPRGAPRSEHMAPQGGRRSFNPGRGNRGPRRQSCSPSSASPLPGVEPRRAGEAQGARARGTVWDEGPRGRNTAPSDPMKQNCGMCTKAQTRAVALLPPAVVLHAEVRFGTWRPRPSHGLGNASRRRGLQTAGLCSFPTCSPRARPWPGAPAPRGSLPSPEGAARPPGAWQREEAIDWTVFCSLPASPRPLCLGGLVRTAAWGAEGLGPPPAAAPGPGGTLVHAFGPTQGIPEGGGKGALGVPPVRQTPRG